MERIEAEHTVSTPAARRVSLGNIKPVDRPPEYMIATASLKPKLEISESFKCLETTDSSAVPLA